MATIVHLPRDPRDAAFQEGVEKGVQRGIEEGKKRKKAEAFAEVINSLPPEGLLDQNSFIKGLADKKLLESTDDTVKYVDLFNNLQEIRVKAEAARTKTGDRREMEFIDEDTNEILRAFVDENSSNPDAIIQSIEEKTGRNLSFKRNETRESIYNKGGQVIRRDYPSTLKNDEFTKADLDALRAAEKSASEDANQPEFMRRAQGELERRGLIGKDTVPAEREKLLNKAVVLEDKKERVFRDLAQQLGGAQFKEGVFVGFLDDRGGVKARRYDIAKKKAEDLLWNTDLTESEIGSAAYDYAKERLSDADTVEAKEVPRKLTENEFRRKWVQTDVGSLWSDPAGGNLKVIRVENGKPFFEQVK